MFLSWIHAIYSSIVPGLCAILCTATLLTRCLHHLPTSWSISCALSTPYSIHRPLQHHSLPAAPLSTWQHMVRIKTDIVDWLYDLFIDFGQHLPTVLMLSLQLLIIPWKYCPFWKASNNTRPPSWSPLSCQTASAAAARRREHEYLCCMIIRNNSSTKIFRICKQHNDNKKIYMHVHLMDLCYLLQQRPRPLRHPLHSYPPDKMWFRFLHHLPTNWSIPCVLSTPHSIHRPFAASAAPLSTWQHMVRIKSDIIDWLYDPFIGFGQHLPTVLPVSSTLKSFKQY